MAALTLTLDEARALGLGHLVPGHRDWRPARTPDGMNKLERAFRDTVLAPALARNDLAGFWREPIRLRLAGRCWYTADFLAAVATDGPYIVPTLVETKGFLRDDASVKIKVAAREYPIFRFLLVYRRQGIWFVHEVGPTSGISPGNVVVPWIHATSSIDNS